MGKILKFDNRKAQELDKSKLLIAYIISEGTDDIGRRFIQTKWGEAKGKISLGSFVKPNRGIYLIKYIIPPK